MLTNKCFTLLAVKENKKSITPRPQTVLEVNIKINLSMILLCFHRTMNSLGLSLMDENLPFPNEFHIFSLLEEKFCLRKLFSCCGVWETFEASVKINFAQIHVKHLHAA